MWNTHFYCILKKTIAHKTENNRLFAFDFEWQSLIADIDMRGTRALNDWTGLWHDVDNVYVPIVRMFRASTEQLLQQAQDGCLFLNKSFQPIKASGLNAGVNEPLPAGAPLQWNTAGSTQNSPSPPLSLLLWMLAGELLDGGCNAAHKTNIYLPATLLSNFVQTDAGLEQFTVSSQVCCLNVYGFDLLVPYTNKNHPIVFFEYDSNLKRFLLWQQ